MRVEVKLEHLLIEWVPDILEDDPSGGRLARLVVAILGVTNPDHRVYPDD